MIEFIVVAPLLAAMGLGTLQAGLAYHGKTVLNYATFEAARTGAVNHALQGPMRRELAMRLAPLQGGDGSDAAAASALGLSIARVAADPFTTLAVLNPSVEAFQHFRIRSRESGRDVIPNSHLRFRDDAKAAIDPVSGVDLRDANLLKIEVVHGFDMKVPLVSAIAAPLMSLIDPRNTAYYRAGKLPLSSVATVRMQSEVWPDSLVAMAPASRAASGPPPADVAVTPDVSMAPMPGDELAEDGPPAAQDDAPSENARTEDAHIGHVQTDEAQTDCEGPFTASSDPFLPIVDPAMCATSDAGVFGDEGAPGEATSETLLPGTAATC